MLLSILIPTLPGRQKLFTRLCQDLSVQRIFLPEDKQLQVEIISNDDSSASIGSKRNSLLEKATGEYVVFIDDDDLVAPNYLELIFEALKTKPDVVGMNLIMTTDGDNAERSFHTLQVKEWYDQPYCFHGKKIYFRCPNHLNPVKRKLALQVKFPSISMGEDKDYSLRLLPLLKVEAWIDQPIYFYLFKRNK